MQVNRVTIYPLGLTMKQPFKTAHGTTLNRPITLVAIQLTNDIVGYGEIQSFADNQYAPETQAQSLQMVRQLAQKLIGKVFQAPEDVARWLSKQTTLSFAKAAIEMAFWDAYGQQTQQSLQQLLGGQQATVAVSTAIGIQPSWQQTIQSVTAAVAAGYRRIKIKITAETDLTAVIQLIQQFPEQMFSVDANASWSTQNIEQLQRLDQAGLALIEQPFAADAWQVHYQAQQTLQQLKLSLDESLNDLADVQRAIRHRTTLALTIKQGKIGGISNAQQAIKECQVAQLYPWIGGMLGTGLGRAVDLALASLPGANIVPADSAQFDHYFVADIGQHLPIVHQGKLLVPQGYGIGVSLNWQVITNTLVHEPMVYE